jgi:hypothetical protein
VTELAGFSCRSLIPTRYNDASTTDLETTVGEKGGEVNLELTD